MSAEVEWIPFKNRLVEENPFHLNLARKSMEHSIQMCWISIPIDKGRSIGKLESQVKLLLEQVLEEVRTDANRHGIF